MIGTIQQEGRASSIASECVKEDRTQSQDPFSPRKDRLISAPYLLVLSSLIMM